jgi:4-hydroxy-4-methyl-2-oxoglutarate aldolase
MNVSIDPEDFDLLRITNTPTIANAMEKLGIRDRMRGFTRGNVRAMFPDLGVMLGYAVTVKIRSARPPEKKVAIREYWDHIKRIPGPRVVVVEDMEPGGAWWGEVNANIHRALGCIGVVTNGTVRDLGEAQPLGFHFFATGIAVSHGYAFPEEFNVPVTVDGMEVSPSELIHADKHGAIMIPVEHVRDLLKAVAAVERYERPMIQLCKSKEFTTGKLEELRDIKF